MKKYLWLLAACSLAMASFSCSSDSDSECLPNEVKCEDGMLFDCTVDEVWAAEGTACESGICENAIKCADPVVSCEPGEKLCKDNVHQECNEAGDAWSKMDCSISNSVCSPEKACVECVFVDDCPSGSLGCKDNVCVLEDVVCTDNTGKCIEGKLHTCKDNTWGDGVACGENHECLDGNDTCTPIEVTTCDDNATLCIDGKLHTCKDNDWGEGTDCADGQECKADATQCTDIETTKDCTDGDTKCDAGLLITCVEGVWGEGAVCPDGQECLDNATECTTIVEACTEGDTKCEHNKIYTCDAEGNWNGENCSQGFECITGQTECTEISCTDGDTRCIDNQIHTCDANNWGEGENCDVGFVCKDGATECTELPSMQCAFTVLEASPEIASATGKVIITKGIEVIGGGVYCGTTLETSPSRWKKSSSTDLPTKNTGYTGDADEWQSGTVIGLDVGTNYCTYVVRLEDEHFYACPVSDTLGEAKVSDGELKLTEEETRTTAITCGNGILDANEECDGTEIDGAVCPEGTVGTVSCNNQCQLNLSACVDSSIDFKHTVSFAGFNIINGYGNTQELSIDGRTVSIAGAIYNEGDGRVIDEETLVIGDKVAGHVEVKSETSDNIGIGILAFDYKSWVNDTFSAEQKLEIFINDSGTAVGEVVLSGTYDTVNTAIITINQDATSFKIAKEPIINNNNPRLLIDNIRWSDKE